MDFARRFEDYQVERIRRAILDYRTKFDVGDVTLTKEILRYLPAAVTYDSTLKNVQRLRRGERMRGQAFLNACIQFLEIQMINPPEEELGLAMKRFVGDIFGFADLWPEVGGNYALRVLGERKPTAVEAFRSVSAPRRGVPINLTQGFPGSRACCLPPKYSRLSRAFASPPSAPLSDAFRAGRAVGNTTRAGRIA
jgi:hypothetical protein